MCQNSRHGYYLLLANKDEATKTEEAAGHAGTPRSVQVGGTPLHFLAEENCSARPSSIRNTVSTP